MPRGVTYDDDFLSSIDRITKKDPEAKTQVLRKIRVIIDNPMSAGRPTANPANCRHVDICRGRLVIFWAYDPRMDIVHFLRFETHKRAFR